VGQRHPLFRAKSMLVITVELTKQAIINIAARVLINVNGQNQVLRWFGDPLDKLGLLAEVVLQME